MEKAHPGYFKANPRRHIIWATFAQFSSVQSLSRVRLFVTPWTAARQAPLSITNSWSLLKLMSIKSVMPSNQLILCRPLLLPPSIFPSVRVFSNESALRIRWPKYWSFSFSISPSNGHPGQISFGMDRLALQYALHVRTCFYENKTTISALNTIKKYFLMSFHNLNVITPDSFKNVFLIVDFFELGSRKTHILQFVDDFSSVIGSLPPFWGGGDGYLKTWAYLLWWIFHCLDWTTFLQNTCIEALIPMPQNVTAFRERAFKELMKIKRRYLGRGT